MKIESEVITAPQIKPLCLFLSILLVVLVSPASAVPESQPIGLTELYTEFSATDDSSPDRSEPPINTQHSRYIDYDNGNDHNPGSRDAPWQHHPWDENASGEAKSAQSIETYIFKKGVTYRGVLNASESGTLDRPITLTVDENWGIGEAILAGSIAYTDGWEPCHARIKKQLPADSKGTSWCRAVNLAQEPRLAWETNGQNVTRIPIARTPNWKVKDRNDPRSEWFELENIVVKFGITVEDSAGFQPGDQLSILSANGFLARNMQSRTERLQIIAIEKNKLLVTALNFDAENLHVNKTITNGNVSSKIKAYDSTHSIERKVLDTRNLSGIASDNYKGATIWAERRSMPKPDAAIVNASSSKDHYVQANFHRTFGEGPMQYDRYYLEGLPQFLDSPGEFIYQQLDSRSGVLVLRLPDDRNPNNTTVEIAQFPAILQIHNQSHIHISGLSFKFSNQIAAGTPQARHASLYASAIQIRGDASDIAITKSEFSHLSAGIVAYPEERKTPSIIDNIEVSGSVFNNIDGSPIALGNGQTHYSLKHNGSRLVHVAVTDNSLDHFGYRTLGHFGVGSLGDGIHVLGGEVITVARNDITRAWGSGISVTLGAEYELGNVSRPFLRSLIYNNSITDSLLGAQDGGGINSWMGGPSYIFNNVSGNPVGCMHSRDKTSHRKDWYRRGCYGVGIYLDGQYKGYVFNNILWGENNNTNDRIYSSAAYNEAMGFMNTVFSNTFYRFGVGLHKGMLQHNRSYYLGNLFLDMSLGYIEQEPKQNTIDLGTLAFSRNAFYGRTQWFGSLGSSKYYSTIDEWTSAMRRAGLMMYDTGTVLADSPVTDAQAHDFSPKGNSPIIDKGVKVFVPWSLYDVVGEWHFLQRKDRADIISGENINMDARWTKRDIFHLIPRNDLHCTDAESSDFGPGTLENWINGALQFDGQNHYCELAKPSSVQSKNKDVSGSGVPEQFDIGSGNFLIETVVQPELSSGPAGLVTKMGVNGYSLEINSAGHIEYGLQYGDDASRRVSSSSVNDGNWHHILVEVDRSQPEGINIFIDGKLANGRWEGVPIKEDVVATDANLIVGRSSAGSFSGKIDFLRVARGTLAQAETSIDELYSWEFSGPQNYDFFGRLRNGIRDIGAVEYAP